MHDRHKYKLGITRYAHYIITVGAKTCGMLSHITLYLPLAYGDVSIYFQIAFWSYLSSFAYSLSVAIDIFILWTV